jgi:hypothetical protein
MIRNRFFGGWLATAAFCFASISSLAAPGVLETPFLRITLGDGCEILDKQAGAVWRSEPGRLGEVTLGEGKETKQRALSGAEVKTPGSQLTAVFHPDETQPKAALRLLIKVLADGRTVEVRYEASPALKVESVSLLDQVLKATDLGRGYVVVPCREGLLIPADSKLNFSHSFDTYDYEGCHMEMLGIVEKGAAMLVSWNDPYVKAEVKSVVEPGGQTVTAWLTLRKTARSFCIHVLGRGDYVSIAKAYRNEAEKRGLLVTWDKKLKGNADRAKLFGAANIKLWSMLDRRMNLESTKEERVHVHWTFDEAAQVAEHLKNDLKLDRVLFTIGGWIHRGYDNQHPDILPTAPECGGDEAFSNCARRVESLGYLFCLHDNYQDIYRDSPSWNERWIMKTADGKLAKGGRWSGGQAYLTCSRMALELAKRPQNLRAVKKLCGANAYFIDTTYAAKPQECFDPAHPLTRADDIHWKQALSDYTRKTFGVFGSECGREWAVPHSDFFEGLTGVSGAAYHDNRLMTNLGASTVPMFELVYRDCIAMYGKYGYDPRRAAPYVLRHISLGRPLNYHSIPDHLYWKQQGGWREPGRERDEAFFVRAENGWAAGMHPTDRFIKNTYEVLEPLNELTARSEMTRHDFLSADRKVERTVFGQGRDAMHVTVNAGGADYVCESELGGKVVLPPYGFLAESPEFVAFHARNWNGINYETPTMFTLRSLDKRPLGQSRAVRIFHATGDAEIRLGDVTRSVEREATTGTPDQTNGRSRP